MAPCGVSTIYGVLTAVSPNITFIPQNTIPTNSIFQRLSTNRFTLINCVFSPSHSLDNPALIKILLPGLYFSKQVIIVVRVTQNKPGDP